MGTNNHDERTPLLVSNGSGQKSNHERNHEDASFSKAPGLHSKLNADTTVQQNGSSSYESDAAHGGEAPGASAADVSYMGGLSKVRFWILIVAMNLSLFMACFDSTLMASSHPVITSYFHSSNSASWLSTAFLMTLTSFQPLFGRVSDTVGRKSLFIFALSVFMGATIWCALAQSILSFIMARALCGLGAGGIISMSNIMINDVVPIEIRGTYQALINLFYGLGNATGAAAGGFLCDTLGWRWTFGIQVPPVLLLIAVALFTIPSNLGPNLAKSSTKSVFELIKAFDLLGSFFLTTTIAFLVLGLNLGGNVLPWEHPLVISSLIVGVITGGILLWVESRHELPVMPLAMITTSPRGNIVFSNFFANICINTVLFNAPLYFQAVKFDTPSVSGFRLTLPSLGTMVCGISSGLYMSKTGRMKGLLLSGAFSLLVGAVLLTALWEGIPTWLATIFVIPPSIGQGLGFPASTIAVLATSTREDQAVMTSTMTVFRSLGIVMGVALSSLILQNALSVYLEQYVTGKHKAEIITKVRKTVRSIIDLDPKHQEQVVAAYRKSLTLTFSLAILTAVITIALTLPIKLPRLGKRRNSTSS